jgi:hypothetical protein
MSESFEHLPTPQRPERDFLERDFLERDADERTAALGTARALETGDSVSRETAEALTRLLLDAAPDAQLLRRMANDPRILEQRWLNSWVRSDYLALYNDETTAPLIRERAAWLGEYLVRSENSHPLAPPVRPGGVPELDAMFWRIPLTTAGGPLYVHVPATMPEEAIAELPAALAPQLDELGDRLRAYLGLDGVDATDALLAVYCEDEFVGEFETREAAARFLMPVDAWEHEIQTLAHEHGIDGMVDLDLTAVHRQLALTYDIAMYGNRYFVFAR